MHQTGFAARVFCASLADVFDNQVPPEWRANVWLGATVENREKAARRLPHLLGVPARKHFRSCEPRLGPLDLATADDPRQPSPSDCKGCATAAARSARLQLSHRKGFNASHALNGLDAIPVARAIAIERFRAGIETPSDASHHAAILLDLANRD